MKYPQPKRLLPLLSLCILPAAACIVSISFSAPPAYARPSHAISILHNGQLMNFDVPPVEIHGRVLVPLRGVFEELGARVDYDSANGNIFAKRGHTEVQLRVGSTSASINGDARELDVPARTYDGRTLVPLRFVSEALGAHVRWDERQRTVYILSEDRHDAPGDHRDGQDHHRDGNDSHSRR